MFKTYLIFFYIILFNTSSFCAHAVIMTDYPPVPVNWQYHVSDVVVGNHNGYDPFDLEVKAPGFFKGEVRRKDLDKVMLYFNAKAESFMVDIFSKARRENKYILINEQVLSEPSSVIENEQIAKSLIILGEHILANTWLEIDSSNVEISKNFFGDIFLKYTIWQIVSEIKIRKNMAEQIGAKLKSAKKNKKSVLINTDYLRNNLKQKWLPLEFFIKDS